MAASYRLALFLPVYVCPQAVGVVGTNPATGNISGDLTFTGCNARNGTLNPNNPFAAAGSAGSPVGDPGPRAARETNARPSRGGAVPAARSVETWNYNIGAAASRVDLDINQRNYIYLKGLITAIGTGSYNFVNQAANSQTVLDQVYLPNDKTSDLEAVAGPGRDRP